MSGVCASPDSPFVKRYIVSSGQEHIGGRDKANDLRRSILYQLRIIVRPGRTSVSSFQTRLYTGRRDTIPPRKSMGRIKECDPIDEIRKSRIVVNDVP